MNAAGESQSRLHIDWTRCDGRGLCTELLPGILRRDTWGYPLARDGEREPAIPAEVLRDARAAVGRCPRLALSVVTSTPKTIERQVKPTGRHAR
ncbi:ferredoxin [Mycobacterium sp. OTB74]|uniref:ferredoxin n=1 Tax=Mycobacterium sp. OTB74 TaxID=1853452 RepID=UPI00247477F8|nr:ferredoxin [Mycobacterium sp. OTB74]